MRAEPASPTGRRSAAPGGLHRAEIHRSALIGVEILSLVSDRSFPRHSHDELGIGLLDGGAHRSWSGVGRVEAAAGEVITVNPGEMHDGDPVGGHARSWRMLYLDPNLAGRLLHEDGAGATEVARPVIRDPLLASRVAEAFAALTEPRSDLLLAEESLLRLLALLFARHGSRPMPAAAPPPAVGRALRRLAEAPERPATLTELAALCGLSRFQLLRGFTRAVGATPHAFQREQRVRLARRLLAKGLRPAAAAAEAGFADQSHLTRAFRHQFGVTPARYRAAIA